MDKDAARRRQKKVERNRRNRQRKARHVAVPAQNLPPSITLPMTKPTTHATTNVRYADPDTLIRFGPIIKGAFSVPTALSQLLSASGRPVPQPVAGYLMIDTGAGTLCVAERVTQELGLKAVGLRDTSGVHGTQQNEVYHIHLKMFFSGGSGEMVSVEIEKAALSVPRLDEHWKPGDMHTGDPCPTRLIGLLGRDFLRHATLNV